MKDLTQHTQKLLCSLVASKGAIVGGKAGAEKELHQWLTEASVFVGTEDQPTMQNVPQELLKLAKEELQNGVPSVDQIKNWFLYSLDLSGTTFYETNDNKLTFTSIIRSLDLSLGSQYYDNRERAFAYSEACKSGDEGQIRCTKDALKANLPNKKLRYLHWIGNKSTSLEAEEFQASNPEYF